jgi:hypothetical protein
VWRTTRPALVNGVDRRDQLFGHVQRLCGGELDGAQRAVVHVLLARLERPDGGRIAGQEGDAPAGHGERLAEREQFDGDVRRALDLEDARGAVAVEGVLAVGVVVDDEDVVPAGELDGALEEREVRRRGGRVVRVVQPEHAGQAARLVRDRVEVDQEVVLGQQRGLVRDGAREDVPDVVGRVARARGNGQVAGV